MEIKSSSSQTSCLLVMLKLLKHQTVLRTKPEAKQGKSLRLTCPLIMVPTCSFLQCRQASAYLLCLMNVCHYIPHNCLQQYQVVNMSQIKKNGFLFLHSRWQTCTGETSCLFCKIPGMVCILNCHHLHL